MKNQLPIINDREQAKRHHIADLILTDVELFRTEASQIYGNFKPAERSLLDGLVGNDIDSYNVLATWHDELLPLNRSLQDKRTDRTFLKIISKNLMLDDSQAQLKIENIIDQRQAEALNDFIYKVYPINPKRHRDVYKKQRKQARALLAKANSEIEQIRNHQIDYMLYVVAANKNSITVIDPHESKSSRRRDLKQIELERKNILAIENERLRFIGNRLIALSAMNGGILVDIFDKKWDLMTVLALRNQYEKLIGKLSESEANDAIKRLEIFDKVTKDFKSEQAAKLTLDSHQTSLTAARTIIKKIDSLLLSIFDLTVIQKNQLVLNTKEYRELKQEQAEILKAQNNRSAHASKG